MTVSLPEIIRARAMLNAAPPSTMVPLQLHGETQVKFRSLAKVFIPPSPFPCSPPPRAPPNQRLDTHQIPTADQIGNIQIQRTLRLATTRHQLLHRLQRAHDAVSRRPARLEQIEADLAGGEGDVGVDGGREEGADGWGGGIVGGEGEGEGEEAAWEFAVSEVGGLSEMRHR